MNAAANNWPRKGLCDGGRAAARRQDDDDTARDLRCSKELLPELRETGRRDDDRRCRGTFELADDSGARRARFIGVGTDVQVRRCHRDEQCKGRSGNHRDQRSIAYVYGQGRSPGDKIVRNVISDAGRLVPHPQYGRASPIGHSLTPTFCRP